MLANHIELGAEKNGSMLVRLCLDFSIFVFVRSMDIHTCIAFPLKVKTYRDRYFCLRLLFHVAAGRSIGLTWRIVAHWISEVRDLNVKARTTGELWILDTARSHELECGRHDSCQR